MRSRIGLPKSLPLQRPDAFKPYKFRGVAIAVHSTRHDEVDSNGVVETQHDIVIRLNNHLEYCRVLDIVRVDEKGALATDNLDNPEVVPWFLLEGGYHNVVRFLIANERDEYYPIEQTISTADIPHLYKLLPLDRHQIEVINNRIYDWSQFSNLDRDLVSEAIQTYLRTEFNA